MVRSDTLDYIEKKRLRTAISRKKFNYRSPSSITRKCT